MKDFPRWKSMKLDLLLKRYLLMYPYPYTYPNPYPYTYPYRYTYTYPYTYTYTYPYTYPYPHPSMMLKNPTMLKWILLAATMMTKKTRRMLTYLWQQKPQPRVQQLQLQRRLHSHPMPRWRRRLRDQFFTISTRLISTPQLAARP
jgi:hypothetical protein